MKILTTYLLLSLTLTGASTYAQNASFEWVRTYGNNSNQVGERAQAMTVDGVGNIYSIGAFQGSVDFDPGAGEFILETGSSSTKNLFVQKLDANGDFIWAIAHEIGNGSNSDIVLDANGDIYITGYFSGIIDIDPGADEFLIGSLAFPSNTHSYVQKLNSNGEFLWAKELVANTDDSVIVVQKGSLLIDNSNQFHLVGEFSGTVDFSFGNGTAQETSGINSSSGVYFRNGFDLTLTTTGDFVEVNTIISNNANSILYKRLDSEGNYIYAGYYDGSPDVDFGGAQFFLPDNPEFNVDVFFMKYDNSGNLLWAKTLLSVGATGNTILSKLLINSQNKIILTGSYNYANGYLDANPGAGEFPLVSNGSFDCYVVQLDSDGDFDWAATFGDQLQERLDDATLGDNDEIYSTGYFRESIDFDTSQGVDIITADSDTGSAVFVHRLSSTGSYGGTSALLSIPGDPIYLSSIRAFQIRTNNQGDLLLFGNFQITVDFDPGEEVFIVESAGGEDDVFILKLSPMLLGLDEVDVGSNFRIYPNPTANSATLDLGTAYQNVKIVVTSVTGKHIQTIQNNWSGSIEISIDGAKGIYLIHVIGEDFKKTLKLIKK